MAQTPENINTPGYWFDQADNAVGHSRSSYERGKINTISQSHDTLALRYEVRALTIQLMELTEIVREHFRYQDM